MFDTDNLHKFSLYNKEMTPNVLLFDFDGHTPIEFISSLERKFERSSIPLIVVSEAPRALIYHPSISHYLTHDEARKRLLDILESYCIGNKKHHILYINLKPYERSDLPNPSETAATRCLKCIISTPQKPIWKKRPDNNMYQFSACFKQITETVFLSQNILCGKHAKY